MFYTSVTAYGDYILFIGIENGQRVGRKIKFRPSLFVPSKDQEYHTIYGQSVGPVNFDSIHEAKEFVNKYKDVDNFPIYGNQNWEYCYIGQTFPGEIQWNANDIRVANIDIEVGSENGFPDVATAAEPITAITIRIGGQTVAFGCGEFNPQGTAIYVKCDNEHDLIRRFIKYWSSDYPDAITGWYIKFFDIPYLINRITKLFGEDEAKKLSPWNYYYKRETILMGKIQHAYVISGIATLDYMELYRKFAPNAAQENYKLDYICSVEIGEKKLSYTEYESLHRLYKEDFQKFMEYNVRDTELVEKLDAKLHLLELAFKLAYDSKSNLDDVFMQVRMWDNIVYNHLWERKIIIPDKKHTVKIPYEGAYVKEPILGKHKWVVSFDLTSLYPHLMMEFNISPETIVDQSKLDNELNEFMQQKINVESLLYKCVDTSILPLHNVTITPNRQLFEINALGFMPEILTRMFADRQKYKKLMIQAEKDLENDPTNQDLKNSVSRYNVFQQSIKVCINSCYGALGNEYFRYFDVRQAEAVTMAGQLSIRWIMNAINGYMNDILQTDNKDYVIASDTDSIYLNLEPLVNFVFKEKEPDTSTIVNFLDKACETKIQPFIDNSYQDLAAYTNAYAQKMIMKREKICDVGIAIGAKNYIWSVWDSEGVRYSEPRIKPVGLKMIKSTTPQVSRVKLREILKTVVHGEEDELQHFVAKFKQEFKCLPLEDIATPTGMNGLSEYRDAKTIYKKGTSIHIKGSLLYNHFLKEKQLDTRYPLIHDGEKVKYTYLRVPNPIKNEVIAFPTVLPKEFGLHPYIDFDRQFNSAFIAPLKAILDVIGWHTEAQTDLEGFFT